jgi:hypothetical protein
LRGNEGKEKELNDATSSYSPQQHCVELIYDQNESIIDHHHASEEAKG